MDKSRILATVRADLDAAKRYYEGCIEPVLKRRYDVYNSDLDRYKKMFPETSEVSQFRTFDLWAAVEWLLPSILKAFFGSDRIISISGVSGEDADRAERIMKLLQWQMTVKNQGYRVFKSWFSDALVTNLGILKCYWKRETETRRNRGVFDRAQLVGLLEGGAKMISVVPDFMSGVAEVEYEEEVVTVNQPVVEVARPGDIRYVPDGRRLAECSLVAHRKLVTIDELRREARRGLYDADIVEYIADTVKDGYKASILDQELNDAEDPQYRYGEGANTEKGRVRVEVFECYAKLDIDGDGLLEDAIVTVCENELLRAVENPYGRAPLFELIPFWDSYQIWSKVGLAEIIEGTQDMHTGLLRQVNVSIGLSNQPRSFINEEIVNLQDLDSYAQFVRVHGDPSQAVYPVQSQGMNPQTFQLFEYLHSQLEQWTPITRYNQGTDSRSLNKTATGISMIMTASQQRQEEIIRNFAETGMSELYRFLIKINQLYLDQPQVIRLQNDIIEFAPDDLEGDFDLSVDASSGIGARDAKVQALTSYLREMWPFAAQIGAATVDQFVMASQKLLRLMGIEDAEKYISMPMLMPGMPMTGGMGVGGQGIGAPAPADAGGQPGVGGAV
jgi:hypothetical protein